jgi:hypothetical protein
MYRNPSPFAWSTFLDNISVDKNKALWEMLLANIMLFVRNRGYIIQNTASPRFTRYMRSQKPSRIPKSHMSRPFYNETVAFEDWKKRLQARTARGSKVTLVEAET